MNRIERIIFWVLLAAMAFGILHIGLDLCNIRRLFEARIPMP